MKVSVPQKIVNDIREKIPNLALLYLTGSRLTGTNNLNSDYDFYAFTISNKKDFVLSDRNKGKTYRGENYEIKCFDITHLFSLLKKTNPNFIEIFFNRPVFIGTYFSTLAEMLYQYRELLSSMDSKHFVGSCVGMIKSNLSRMSPDKVYHGSGSFGKELFNLIKAYRYGISVYNNTFLENEVYVCENTFLEVEISGIARYMYVKNTDSYDKDLLHFIDPEGLYKALKEKYESMETKTDFELMDKLIYNTPLFIEPR
ncbi:DNA polymerase beta superfamily protein [Liquorilactobacillus mali]|uniref:Uncharacterized protein n=1 Tax=Liquorilactobacillus mali KCTC 3596 = DSM 20444 TaxID=1046596 RepID=A0A0R2DZJ8_9LACO|nr:nucleotidyltransferase domain-containing protein [Liquorilactobacillus mali]KRN09390.1 hypothetical protein FD00_GL001113 [Liquorilactobacillus mali KCTC 3596 = DSM 20444]